MASDNRTSKARQAPPSKPVKKPSLIQRLIRRLDTKGRQLKREDPNIYPLY